MATNPTECVRQMAKNKIQKGNTSPEHCLFNTVFLSEEYAFFLCPAVVFVLIHESKAAKE